LKLDAPIAAYLPPELATRTNGATLRQVLSMRSGIAEHVTDEYLAEVVRHPARRWQLEEVLGWVPKDPAFIAGAAVEYCNTNYILAGAVIESVTGMPAATSLRQGILARADLPRLFLQGRQRPLPPLALPHTDFPGFPAAEHVVRRGGGLLPTRSLATAAWTAGGMAADASALAAWGFLLYGGFLLPPEQTSAMAEVSADTEYSIGTMHLGEYGLDAIGHPGRIPGYATILAVLPRLGIAVAVLVNSDAPVPADVAGTLLATLD
jgi:D-alanyl-D-alanine carboxypeptidase